MDGALRRITQPLLDVLEVLVDGAVGGEELHGWAIMKRVGRSGPTVYGVIDRLEDAGLIMGRWEDENPHPNKPRRRLYQLNAQGLAFARTVLAKRRPAHAQQTTGRHAAFPPRPRLVGGEP